MRLVRRNKHSRSGLNSRTMRALFLQMNQDHASRFT
jgi:hypothetical protein